MLWRLSQAPQRVVALQHLADVENEREAAALFHMLVIVAGVGCQHHPAALAMNPYRLQARRMAADMVDADARRDLVVAVMEDDPVLENHAHHSNHMLDLVGTT